MTVSSELSFQIESEITLLVVSDNPERVRTSLNGMNRIGNYALVPAEALIIEDVYLDTLSGDLATQSWVLRVRRENDRTCFTLKGPAHRGEWGGIQRIEIEEPWSRDAPARIRNHLAASGLHIDPLPCTAGDAPAVDALKDCGFVILQQRQTQRDRRIVEFPAGGSPVAELVVDRVLYRFGSQHIRHMEVEIEAHTPAQVSHAKAVADGLLEAIGPELRPWGYGKLATGKILETLVEAGELSALVRPDKYPVPIVYTLIESRLKKRTQKGWRAWTCTRDNV
jgi:hypothetical protein